MPIAEPEVAARKLPNVTERVEHIKQRVTELYACVRKDRNDKTFAVLVKLDHEVALLEEALELLCMSLRTLTARL